MLRAAKPFVETQAARSSCSEANGLCRCSLSPSRYASYRGKLRVRNLQSFIIVKLGPKCKYQML
jgi:hypothetical protein